MRGQFPRPTQPINDQLKNISQIEHSRHRSVKGFLLTVLGGLIAYCAMKTGTGRWREISPCVVMVTLLFVLKMVFVDTH
ncbi:hypothetical protein CKY04_22895 [Photorhabdus sp. S8-52]|uniref:hypothetical protein n=1 Tax=Photorhabdus sp. RM105S TaxID=3342823 RepID=UPI000DCDFA05|nr:hypothetical protein CKY05_22900 [Photorhabdus sp. S10-54]RAW92806.1 hypothetical protein CKY03_22795 [Photorhabdus sp. S9-53]RAW96317.1 hypothetical protein CKY04_22895 [Photorhabdus sp. S8-52]